MKHRQDKRTLIPIHRKRSKKDGHRQELAGGVDRMALDERLEKKMEELRADVRKELSSSLEEAAQRMNKGGEQARAPEAWRTPTMSPHAGFRCKVTGRVSGPERQPGKFEPRNCRF